VKLWISLFFLLIHSLAFANPEMIRHGYISCKACHFSARGSGLLSPYGKGISKAFSMGGGEYKPGSIAKAISFNGKMAHALQMRGAGLVKKNPDESKIFPMQFDYLTRLEISKGVSIDATLARVPYNPPALDHHTEDNFATHFVFRKATVDIALDKKSSFSFGRDHLPLGIGLVDHTTYIKERNRMGVTDFPTQGQLNFWSGQHQSTLLLFAPSFQEAEGNGEFGLVAKTETMVFKKLAVGANILAGRTQSIERWQLGQFVRYSAFSTVFLFEFDYTVRELRATGKSFSQFAVFFRPRYYIKDYLYFGASFEHVSRKQQFKMEESKYGPSMGLKLSRNLVLEFDGRLTKREKSDQKYAMAQLYVNLW
jgi:hypothetical protein